MKQMFASATFKLTGWYLAILMVISLFFSVIIYQISSAEVRTRLHIVEEQFSFPLPVDTKNGGSYGDFQRRQLVEANVSLALALFYANILILLLGGVGSYFMARRTLAPIEAFQEAQERFTADASHELRTPLAIMKSELEVAARDSRLSKGEMRELLESNLEEVNRLSQLSDTLLKLSRRDFAEIEFSLVDVGKLLGEVTRGHKGLPAKRFTLQAKKQLLVRGNHASLRELFAILVDNALRYSPGDSSITISTRSKAGMAVIEISNSGPGIEKSDLPHVFDRFYRGEKSRTTAAGGYGLGLALAKNIVDLHGGEISIDSTPGKITSVKVQLQKSSAK